MKNWNFFEFFWKFWEFFQISDFFWHTKFPITYLIGNLNWMHCIQFIATNRLVTDDHPYKWTCHGRSRHGRVTDEAKTCDKKKRKHTWMPIGSVHEIRAFIFNVDEREWHRLHCISFQLLTKLSENVWNREPFFMNKYLMTQFSSIRSSIFSKYFFQNCLKCMSPFS